MRVFISILIGLVFLFLAACSGSMQTTVKVGHEIKNIANGKMIASPDSDVEKIRFVGQLELMEGTLQCWLSNPTGDTVYARTFNAVFNSKIDTSFTSIPGDWIFTYQISRLDDIVPSGNFEFSMKY